MKNVIKGFVVAALALSIVACKNESGSTNTASVSAPVTSAAAPADPAMAAQPAAATPAPTVPATVEKVTPNTAQTASAKPTVVEPAVSATPAASNGKTTAMKFSEQSYDWGTIKEGEKMTHVFKFKNTGSNDLIISDARGSCGCTVPEWPKEPIKPGKSGEMKVVFDSNGKAGDQQKTVTVTANTEPANMMVVIKGKVTAKEGAAATN